MKSYKHNLIGKHVRITHATNENLIGVQGSVVDETTQTLVIQTPTTQKRVLKKDAQFEVEGKTIDGTTITKRIEERIRK